jgi:hypothetical protein
VMKTRKDRKVRHPIPDTCSVCRKTKQTEIRKKNIPCWQCAQRSAMHAFRLVSSLNTEGRPEHRVRPARFVCHGDGSPHDISSICFAQENWNMWPGTHSDK